MVSVFVYEMTVREKTKGKKEAKNGKLKGMRNIFEISIKHTTFLKTHTPIRTETEN